MKIKCAKHLYPVRFICVVSDCRNSFLCEDCIPTNMEHIHNHKSYVFQPQEFKKFNSPKQREQLLASVRETFRQAQLKFGVLQQEREGQRVQLQRDLRCFEKKFSQEFQRVKRTLIGHLTSHVDKCRNKLLQVKTDIAKSFEIQQNQTGLLNSIFGRETSIETEQDVKEFIKKYSSIFRARNEVLKLKADLLNPDKVEYKSEDSKFIIDTLADKFLVEIKPLLRNLRAIYQNKGNSLQFSSVNRDMTLSGINFSYIDPTMPVADPVPPVELQLPRLELNYQGVVEGPVLCKDGLVFKGSFKKGLRHGFGTANFKDGNFYQGYWKDGFPHGYGRIIRTDKTYYQGEIVRGLAEGHGELFGDFYKYAGTWKANRKQGKGEQVSKGYRYEGTFMNDFFEGKGILQTNQFNYEGGFEKGKFNGIGIIAYKSGNKFNGNFNQGLREGKGIIVFQDSSKFEGTFHNDLPQGHGVFIWPDGLKWEGTFHRGQQQGQGIQIDQQGNERRGVWRDGYFLKWIF